MFDLYHSLKTFSPFGNIRAISVKLYIFSISNAYLDIYLGVASILFPMDYRCAHVGFISILKVTKLENELESELACGLCVLEVENILDKR